MAGDRTQQTAKIGPAINQIQTKRTHSQNKSFTPRKV